MSHVNQQARDVVKSRLVALDVFGSVSSNRGADLVDSELPAAIVQTDRDAVEDASKAWADDGLESRKLELAVVIVADADEDGLDDTLDALRAQVEAAIGADDTLGGIAKRAEHTGGELDLGRIEDGERWYAFLALTWEVEMWTHKGDPETAA